MECNKSILFQKRMNQVSREVCQEMKFTQSALSQFMGHSHGYVGQRTQGNREWNVTDACKFAEEFRYSLNWLVFGTGPKKLLDVVERKSSPDSDELLNKFMKKCKESGFAVAGCWLEHELR